MGIDTARRPVCVVTGATHGIGLATAIGLAKSGAVVIVAGRDPALTAHAVAIVSRKAGSAHVESALGDLSSQSGVRRLADQVTSRHESVDVLVNNAGTIRRTRAVTEDGVESTWAVNTLAPYLLTSRLFRALQNAAPSRIINVASASQGRGRIDFDDLLFERRPYDMMVAYAQSKLALVMLTMEFARRWHVHRVTANSVHPGFIGSNLGMQTGGLGAVTWWLLRTVLPSPEKGARTSIYLATDPAVSSITGRYFVNGQPGAHNQVADDLTIRERLWDTVAEMVGSDGGPGTR